MEKKKIFIGSTLICAFIMVAVMSGAWATKSKQTLDHDRKTYQIVDSAEAFVAAYEHGKLAALEVQASEYVEVLRAIMTASQSQGLNIEHVLDPFQMICGNCERGLQESMIHALTMPGMTIVGARTTREERDAFLKTGACPNCGHTRFHLLTLPNYAIGQDAEVSLDDIEKLREYSGFVAKAWWTFQSRDTAICDRCNATIRRNEGYASGDIVHGQVSTSRIFCSSCADKSFNQEGLEALRKDPHYFGTGRLTKAREYSQWLRPTPATDFKAHSHERFLKNLPQGGTDLLTQDRIPAGRGYQVTGGDILASGKLKQMYIDFFAQNMSREDAEKEFWKLFVKWVIYPHNMAFFEENLHFVHP
jgi:hypothetical protein